MSAVNGRVYINGKPLAEPWLPQPAPVTSPSPLPERGSASTTPITVPAGEYYVMGDNRTDSEDSRYFGPIPENLIVGKMAFVAWPLTDADWLAGLSAAGGGASSSCWCWPSGAPPGPGPTGLRGDLVAATGSPTLRRSAGGADPPVHSGSCRSSARQRCWSSWWWP